MRYEEALAAVRDGERDRLRVLLGAEPGLATHRDETEHGLLDHAIEALLTPDWSRPPAPIPDEDGHRIGIVRDLLDAGAPPNRRTALGWTPLHGALYAGHAQLAEELMARGADPTAECRGAGGTPLVHALYWGHAAAADVMARHDVTPLNLRVAAGLGRADLITDLFEADGRLSERAGTSRAWYRPHDDLPPWQPTDDAQEILDEALGYAARNGRESVLPLLCARGAQVNGDPYGGTPLHWAASRGDEVVCRWLLDHRADVNRRATFGAQRGATPLHCAAWLDRLDVARLLLARGADAALADETHGGTPLDWAEHVGAVRVADLLSTP